MVTLIKSNMEKIADACKKHHVKALYLFGSAARSNDFTEKSDVDFLVEYNYKEETNDNNVFERVENAESLKEKLEKIMTREVDLIQEKNIRNKFLKYFINKEKKLIYGVS
jgi:predicted nucleotidyltransferase